MSDTVFETLPIYAIPVWSYQMGKGSQHLPGDTRVGIISIGVLWKAWSAIRLFVGGGTRGGILA